MSTADPVLVFATHFKSLFKKEPSPQDLHLVTLLFNNKGDSVLCKEFHKCVLHFLNTPIAELVTAPNQQSLSSEPALITETPKSAVMPPDSVINKKRNRAALADALPSTLQPTGIEAVIIGYTSVIKPTKAKIPKVSAPKITLAANPVLTDDCLFPKCQFRGQILQDTDIKTKLNNLYRFSCCFCMDCQPRALNLLPECMIKKEDRECRCGAAPKSVYTLSHLSALGQCACAKCFDTYRLVFNHFFSFLYRFKTSPATCVLIRAPEPKTGSTDFSDLLTTLNSVCCGCDFCSEIYRSYMSDKFRWVISKKHFSELEMRQLLPSVSPRNTTCKNTRSPSNTIFANVVRYLLKLAGCAYQECHQTFILVYRHLIGFHKPGRRSEKPSTHDQKSKQAMKTTGKLMTLRKKTPRKSAPIEALVDPPDKIAATSSNLAQETEEQCEINPDPPNAFGKSVPEDNTTTSIIPPFPSANLEAEPPLPSEPDTSISEVLESASIFPP